MPFLFDFTEQKATKKSFKNLFIVQYEALFMSYLVFQQNWFGKVSYLMNFLFHKYHRWPTALFFSHKLLNVASSAYLTLTPPELEPVLSLVTCTPQGQNTDTHTVTA